MVNSLHFRDEPLAAGELRPGESSRQALDVWGIDDAESWSFVGLVRYRSRRDLVEIATDPAFGNAHLYELAALQRTIAVPVEPILMLGSPRVLLALVGIVLGALLHHVLGRRAA